MCGDEIDCYSALHYLKKEFKAKNLSVTEIKRGMLDLPVKLLHKPNAGEEKNETRIHK